MVRPRQRLSEHLLDNLGHIRRRKGSQRLGANIAQCAKTQAKRHGGKFVRRIEDCHNIISALRPEQLLYGHSEGLGRPLESLCPLRRVLGIADSLVGEIAKHDISYHRGSPWLSDAAEPSSRMFGGIDRSALPILRSRH